MFISFCWGVFQKVGQNGAVPDDGRPPGALFWVFLLGVCFFVACLCLQTENDILNQRVQDLSDFAKKKPKEFAKLIHNIIDSEVSKEPVLHE